MVRLWRALVTAASVLLLPVDAHAYEIRPKSPVHEAMTRLAEACAQTAPSAEEIDCRSSFAQLDRHTGFNPFRRFTDLQAAVRWSDDPTRQISITGIAKFAISAGFTCPSLVQSGPGAGDFSPARGGLLCSSHYGGLQFLHGMQTRAGETPAQTKARIMAWALLTYNVASGRQDTEVPYCAYFQTRNSAISADVAAPDFPFCEDRTVGGREYAAWRLGTLFSLTCRNPFGSARCSEAIGDRGRRLAELHAAGALLHLVQDSYSESHVQRGASDMPLGAPPRVRCELPRAFRLYDEATADEHSKSDKTPVLDPSCDTSDRAADDAITASAVIIWHLKRKSDPRIVEAYLRSRVFGA